MNQTLLRQIAVRCKAALVQELSPLTDTPQKTAELWFVRLTALRFLEANRWLPDGKELFPPEVPRTERILSLCRMLARTPALADMFRESLPLPDAVTDRRGIFMTQLMQISSRQWNKPELLGWLYQYQNAEEREQTSRRIRSHGRITPEQIPAATQMFTPDWIVQYLTQNALGMLRTPCSGWKYCISSPPQTDAVQEQLTALMHEQRSRRTAELTVIDPCMGTGHILAYVFDALMELYLREGAAPEQAAVQILEQNLYGLDIDAYACHLASFVLLMKARRYVPDLLSRPITLRLFHFSGLAVPEGDILPEYHTFAAQFADAENFGSLLRPVPCAVPVPCGALSRMQELSCVLSAKYDAVITNPPYMSSSSMNRALSAFVRRHYPDSKSDLFAAFMERCTELTAADGCCAMITQHSWMFLSSYEKLRRKMRSFTLQSLVHLGARAFSQADVGIIVQTAAFVCMGSEIGDYRTPFLRLTEAQDKEHAFFLKRNRYVREQRQMEGIAGDPLCYWISSRMHELLQRPKLGESCKICQGMTTSDNRRFLRCWHEVPRESIAFGCRNAQEAADTGKRWFPYNKGGKVRKWYGNHTHVVDFYRNGEEMRDFHAMLNLEHSGGRIKNEKMYFRPALTWPFITESSRFGARYQPEGFLFDVSGSCLFPQEEDAEWIMGFLASRVALEILRIYNPTMNFQVENISNLPLVMSEEDKPEVGRLVQENIAAAREDWDSHEQSWDFTVHPLVQEGVTRIADAFAVWEEQCRRRRELLRSNEQRLNEIFIRICKLEGEISPVVSMDEITLPPADLQRDVRELISFAVGCMFGRYAVSDFAPLAENYLPIKKLLPELERFLTAVYGAKTLEENLAFIAQVLTGKQEHAREALAQELMQHFYADHCRMYKQRPVYWMTDTGRRHVCRGLMYLHRMDASQTELIWRDAEKTAVQLAGEIAEVKHGIAAAESKVQCYPLNRRLAALEGREQELAAFLEHLGELSGMEILPDAGVIPNYERFRSILAPLR